MGYASFSKRSIAFVLDFALAAIPINIVEALHENMILQDAVYIILEIFSSILILAVIAYYIIGTTSESCASFGKKVTGIIVTDLQGKKLSVGRAILRLVCLYFNCFLHIFGIGFLFLKLSKDKRSFHDLICSTVVVVKGTNRDFFIEQNVIRKDLKKLYVPYYKSELQKEQIAEFLQKGVISPDEAATLSVLAQSQITDKGV